MLRGRHGQCNGNIPPCGTNIHNSLLRCGVQGKKIRLVGWWQIFWPGLSPLCYTFCAVLIEGMTVRDIVYMKHVGPE